MYATDGPVNDIEYYDFHVDSFIVRLPTSINEIESVINLNVYSNPNNGVFTLDINAVDISELIIKVINLHGQVVFIKNNFNNVSEIHEQVDLRNNAKGIYFVTVTTDKGVRTSKIIVK